MRVRPNALHAVFLRPRPALPFHPRPRSLLTLAIETSCDDTSVAILEAVEHRPSGHTAAQLHFHKKVTANNLSFNGVHPLVALESHQENLASLVAEAIENLPDQQPVKNQLDNGSISATKRLPDFVAVTRGPGMRSNLFTGLDTAKGLAVAWQKPLLGIHHMHAHALTPRLNAAMAVHKFIKDKELGLEADFAEDFRHIKVTPDFPFLSVLVSGGHTLLVASSSLTDHEILGSTMDIAIGECLDKIARVVLPATVLQKAGTTMYGALLEGFVFSTDTNLLKPEHLSRLQKATTTPWKELDGTASTWSEQFGKAYGYYPPKNNEEAKKRNVSQWGWSLNQPLAKAAGGLKSKSMEMSFSGLTTAVERIVRYKRDPITHKLTNEERIPDEITIQERQDLAKYAMRAAFEHLVGRILLELQQRPVQTIVMSGGVAANSYLAAILSNTLCAHGFGHVKVIVPPPSLCCDNAAMIAWAGIEMYNNGARDRLSMRAVRKWPLDQLLSPPSERTHQFPAMKKPEAES